METDSSSCALYPPPPPLLDLGLWNNRRAVVYLSASEGGAGRRLELQEDYVDADQPASRREAHRLRRVARPGAGRRQNGGVLADGQGDVLVHVGGVAAVPHRRPRHRHAQDDPTHHSRARRRGLSQLHGSVTVTDPNSFTNSRL